MIERAAKKAAAARREAFGSKFSFRGAEVEGTISVSRQPIQLESGGYRAAGLATIRLSAEIQPAPAEQEEILEIATGVTWYVIARPGTNAHNPIAQEHVFDVATA
jgi:hypothetical protein